MNSIKVWSSLSRTFFKSLFIFRYSPASIARAFSYKAIARCFGNPIEMYNSYNSGTDINLKDIDLPDLSSIILVISGIGKTFSPVNVYSDLAFSTF